MVQKSLSTKFKWFLDHSDSEADAKSLVRRIIKLVNIEHSAITVIHVELLGVDEATLKIFDPNAS